MADLRLVAVAEGGSRVWAERWLSLTDGRREGLLGEQGFVSVETKCWLLGR